MVKITSIRLVHTSHAFQPGYFDDKHILKIFLNGVFKHYIYNGVSSSPLREYEYKISNDQVVEFFRVLEEEIQIESWSED